MFFLSDYPRENCHGASGLNLLNDGFKALDHIEHVSLAIRVLFVVSETANRIGLSNTINLTINGFEAIDFPPIFHLALPFHQSLFTRLILDSLSILFNPLILTIYIRYNFLRHQLRKTILHYEILLGGTGNPSWGCCC